MRSIWKDFKPSVLFILKFVGLYLLLNLAYTAYLYTYEGETDPMTKLVTNQSAKVLSVYRDSISTMPKEDGKSRYILYKDREVLSVYEGCNGLNVMIIFVVFLFAYSTYRPELLWFIPLGLAVIHLFNLARIILLFHVTLSFPDALYFTHKYLFTAFIYLSVFILWYFWIVKLEVSNKAKAT